MSLVLLMPLAHSRAPKLAGKHLPQFGHVAHPPIQSVK